MEKAKAGVVAASAQWFADVGLQGEASEEQKRLSEMLQGDLGRIRAALEPHFRLVDPGPVTSVAQANDAVRRFLAEGVELVILVHVMWSEDPPLVRLLEELKELPFLAWCFNPYDRLPESMSTEELFRASGSVGFLQGSVPLSRSGARWSFLFGSPDAPGLQEQLGELSRVFAVLAALKRLRVGRIGPPCRQMAGTVIDEARLASRLGVSVVPLTAHRLLQESRALSGEAVRGFVAQLRGRYPIVEVSEASLEQAARVSLAVGALMEKENLGAAAIEDLDPELHELLQTRPCLWVPGLRERGAVTGMEADILAAIGMWLTRNLGASTPMYTEVFTYDRQDNCLLLGHAAMHDPELAGDNEITIIPDREYQASDPIEGAWTHFAARPGPVTLVSFSEAPGSAGYRVFCVRGEVLPARAKLAGFAHALVRIEAPVEVFFERAARLGMMQHFALSYDPMAGRLEELCRIAGMEYASV